jgi:integrase
MTRDNILSYLDNLRKPEESDPDHKWIGTYNLRKVYIQTFFKWIYYSNLEPRQRPTPDVMLNIHNLKRKEISTIKPSDLWTAEDNALFLKYCPSKRDRAYHAIARDSSCRPGEILNLTIGDVIFKMSGTNQYAEIVVSGKTGKRSIPLFAAVPYVKDWIDNHPQGRNPKVFLIPSLDKEHKTFGNRMKESSLNGIYRRYKVVIFPKFLDDPKVVPEDKKKIKELLLKKWHPYVLRHSALTAKSTILKEHTLRQHAGWTGKSMMHMKYLHYFGNESNESLLAEYGIVTEANKGNVLLPDNLRPKLCPNCNESNIPDCKFCAKCRMVLTYDAYEETIEEQKTKDNQLKDMALKIALQQETQQIQQKTIEMILKNMEEQKQLQEQILLLQQQQHQQKQESAAQQQLPLLKRKLEGKQKIHEVITSSFAPDIMDFTKRISAIKIGGGESAEGQGLLPEITKEQKEKWHHELIEGVRIGKEDGGGRAITRTRAKE